MMLPLDPALDASPDRIGGKAASLLAMARLGLPVPPAFVLPTEVARHWLATGAPPAGLARALQDGLAFLEGATGRRFGAGPVPLLLAIRSGAPVSMPGMMDTLLNLGLNDATVAALARTTGDPGFGADLRAAFTRQFTELVGPVPEDPFAQLVAAVEAVFASWNSRRARRYRAHHGIADDLGTAVTVQAMVFGTLDDRSGTGVLFSRNPIDGNPEPWGEWLPRAQGEALVAGTRDPLPLASLAAALPEVAGALLAGAQRLEEAAGDAQDIEFTVEAGRLFYLQSRPAKRTAEAAVRIAVDLHAEGRIDRATAVARVTPDQLARLRAPVLAGAADRAPLARGEPASPGAGGGVAVATSREAEARAAAGEAVVLLRPVTSPEDIGGMIAASAVVTEVGGATSHAAVVGRALGKPVVTGCGPGAVAALAGRAVTVCGTSGRVFEGILPMVRPAPSPALCRYREMAVEEGDAARLAAIDAGGA